MYAGVPDPDPPRRQLQKCFPPTAANYVIKGAAYVDFFVFIFELNLRAWMFAAGSWIGSYEDNWRNIWMSGLFNAIQYYQKASIVGNILKANIL